MRTIWKFRIKVVDEQIVEMPAGASIIFVGKQTADVREITLWAIVDPDAPTEERKILVAGTGHALQGGTAYLGSVIADPFVWHVFESTFITP